MYGVSRLQLIFKKTLTSDNLSVSVEIMLFCMGGIHGTSNREIKNIPSKALCWMNRSQPIWVSSSHLWIEYLEVRWKSRRWSSNPSWVGTKSFLMPDFLKWCHMDSSTNTIAGLTSAMIAAPSRMQWWYWCCGLLHLTHL